MRKPSFYFILFIAFLYSCNNQNDNPVLQKDVIDSRPPVGEYKKKLQENSVLTTAQLDTTKDENLVDKIMYNLYNKMADNPGDESVFNNLNKPRQYIYAMYELEQEVNNGGFSQYFLNDAGRLTGTAIEGLKSIKAHQFAALVTRADSIFRLPQKSSKEDLYNELDKEFYAFYDKENLAQLNVAYIRGNLEAFADK